MKGRAKLTQAVGLFLHLDDGHQVVMVRGVRLIVEVHNVIPPTVPSLHQCCTRLEFVSHQDGTGHEFPDTLNITMLSSQVHPVERVPV
jgi:hypothetical protein